MIPLSFKRAFWVPFALVGCMWFVMGGEWLADIDLSHWGILPRTLSGLRGVVFGPLLHGNVEHLAANTVPFLVLGGGIWYFYRPIAFKLFFWSWLMAGLWTWAGGRPAYHIGASGLIYAFAAFLFFSGVVRRNVRLAAISLIVVFLYGSMIWGILPILPEYSWEGHLSGAVGGLILAFYYRNQGPHKKKHSWGQEEWISHEMTYADSEDIQYFYDEKEK